MSDIRLDPITNADIDLSTEALELVDGTDAIAQHLLIRLRFVKGEYFLDTRLGVPYFEDIFIKNPNLVVVRALFRETILETPGVLSIERFDMDFDTANRKLRVDFTCSVTTQEEPLDFSEEFLIGQ